MLTRRMVVQAAAALIGTDTATPEDFGAAGDGRADDGPALERLSTWLNAAPGRKALLRRPYRVGRRVRPMQDGWRREGALTIRRPSGVALVFEGGTLLLDNLDGRGLGDQFHGIYVEGPGDGVKIVDPVVRWLKAPSGRSQGDGIRLHGRPSVEGAIRRVLIERSVVVDAPQAGLILTGCADVTVSAHHAERTMGDGCHVNASHGVKLGRISGNSTGDDVCAFVTYLKASAGGVYGDDYADPFGLPGPDIFCNTDCSVHTVIATGGAASGLRLAQSSVHAGEVHAADKEQAVIADGGLAGSGYAWSNLQPVGRVGLILARNCQFGLRVRSFNLEQAGGRTVQNAGLYKIALSVGRLETRDCPFGLSVANIDGLKLDHTRIVRGKAQLADVYDCDFGSLRISDPSALDASGEARQQVRAITYDQKR